jgi:hypothetical protein
MSEAEVSLRLAFWLIREKLVSDSENQVLVAIDNAQIRVGKVVVFDVAAFLRENHWSKADSIAGWRGTHRQAGLASRLVIHSKSEYGAVVCQLQDGRVFRAEAKKGPLTTSKNSEEYTLIREALGQLLTLESASDKDLLAVAVPCSPRFTKLAERWREAPLIKKLGIHILVVGRDDKVDGLSARSLEEFRKHQEATAVREILDSMVRRELSSVTPRFPAVTPTEYPGYMNFAREGMRKSLQWPHGYQLDSSMARVVQRWAATGCNKELLLRIAKTCFEWVPPEDRPISRSPD